MTNKIEQEWETESGLRARVVLTIRGYRCGYVRLPSSCPTALWDLDSANTGEIEVHGGITYSGKRFDGDGDPGWWLGFDCAHFGDLPSPEHLRAYPNARMYSSPTAVHRTLDYCIHECELLAKQVAAYGDLQ